MVSMARPFLADPGIRHKAAKTGRTRSTPASPATRPASTTCSSKACLLPGQSRACFETELTFGRVPQPKKQVVGAGPAGLAFACYAAEAAIR